MPSDSLLHRTAYSGDVEELEDIYNELKRKRDFDINAKGAQGRTPIMRAAGSTSNTGDALNCVKFLIQNGADPKQTDAIGRTCIHWAALGNNPTVIQHLVSMNIDPNAKTDQGTTALFMAAQNGKFIYSCLYTSDDESV